jgi:hypothetical protein
MYNCIFVVLDFSSITANGRPNEYISGDVSDSFI